MSETSRPKAVQSAIRWPAVSDELPPVVREAFKALTGVIGWVGASVAGITALCYGAGYFVIHTHLSMLGLSDVVEVSNNQLLLEGGRFFFWTLGQLAVGWMIIVVIGTLICVLVRVIYAVPRLQRSKVVGGVRKRMTTAGATTLRADLLALAAIGIVIWHYNQFYDPMRSILGLSNLAFSTPADPNSAAGMIASGTTANRAALIDSYNFFVRVYALFVAATWLIIFQGSNTAYGKAANFLFIVYTVLLTALLPQAFAVLVRTPYYPVANLALKNGQQVHGFILQRTDRSFLIWNAEARRVAALSNADVSGFEVVGERDIFEKERGQ
jgi:hypothetical protein